jgi:hypothetical protein
MPYRRIKKQWPNGVLNGLRNHLTGGLPNDYRETNGYSTKTRTEKSTEKSMVKLTSKVYQVDQDSLKHRRYWNQPPPEDFHRGRRIRGRRSQEKFPRKGHGRSEKSTKISTEMPTDLPTEKQSTDMTTKKSTGRSPTHIRNHITEKHLLANANDYGGIQQSMRKHST